MNFHTARFMSTACLPFAFDPDAQCQRWEGFLDEVLPDPESRQLLQEVFGYSLTHDTSQQKFFVFVGSGGNGKSVVQQVLLSLLEPANVSAVPLKQFGEKFALAVTLGKLVNLTSEAGDFTREGEEQLKRFTGGEVMQFERKYGAPFPAKPTARLIVSTNELPKIHDRSDGLWRRLIVLPFLVTIPEEKRKPHLVDELRQELSGIFLWAVAGAQRLQERGRFIEPDSCRVAWDTFKRDSNSARLFLEEHYQARQGGEVGTVALYSHYRDFCQKNTLTVLNRPDFTKEVKRVFPDSTIKKVRLKGSRPHMVVGIVPREE